MEKDSVGLASLPPELILAVGGYLGMRDLNSLVQTAKQFDSLLSPQLYSLGAVHVGIRTTPLIWATGRGHHSTVERLLEKGADPSILVHRTCAFREALRKDNPRILRLLLATGVQPSIEQHQPKSLLQMAVIYDRVEMLRMVLEAAPGHYPDESGEWVNALTVAVHRSRVAAARCLLEAATKTGSSAMENVNASAVLEAVRSGSCDMVRLLAEFGWESWGPLGRNGFTPLHVAAREGDTEMTRLLLSYGSDVSAPDRQRWTPLHRAVSPLGDVSAGHLKVIDLLLEAGANVNSANPRGSTPLHVAIRAGKSLELAEHLIKSGADVNAVNGASDTPFSLAALEGNRAFIQRLLDAGADMEAANGAYALNIAAGQGHVEVIEFLVDAGLDVNRPDGVHRSPLLTAAEHNQLDAMRILLQLGADPNFFDRNGRSAVFETMAWDHVEALKLLLRAGADVSSPIPNGKFYIHYAVTRGLSVDFVQALLDHGADPQAIDPYYHTVLHNAAYNRQYKIVPLLLKAGAAIEARDSRGDTPLLIAAGRNLEVTRELLRGGADANAGKACRQTPLHRCSYATQPELCTLLIEAGADVAAKDHDGRTPLHAAALQGHTDIFEQLLEQYNAKDLDYMARDRSGRSILELAAIGGNTGIISMIAGLVDINMGVHTAHGKHRGVPALHEAILRNQTEAVACLLGLGADPFMLDVFGRTAADWAALEPSGDVLRELLRHGDTFPATDPAKRTSVLKASVAGLASRILEGDAAGLYELAKCLQYLGDLESAAAVFAETEAFCDKCTRKIPQPDMRFVCTECPAIDLCAACMTEYETENFQVQICRGHRFWGLVVSDHRLPGQPFEGEELEAGRREWLQNLVAVYSDTN
ncbi:ankyrin repeat-containing domain protein [Aspergillus lucknowensis]|uniref:Ankyrin repeat-containing domain protein n=1 Tax=Aspergillus lucknowensis TaxID=176173 RepID=A0ABR4LKX9_9EURO